MAGTCNAQVKTGSHKDAVEKDPKTGAVTKWQDVDEFGDCNKSYSVLDKRSIQSKDRGIKR